MKKKFALPSFFALISMSIVGTIAGSLAWLSDKADIATNSNLGGSSDGAYFAYGDGTAADDPLTPVKEGPYGIETARQLYNLAWLQYFGYFNKIKNNRINPVYFELNANIDMTGWVLPPIGTTEYPFIGEFNGKGYTVSNLVTSNNYDQILDTNKLPGRIKQAGSVSNVNIVGMFGVVGNLNNAIPAGVTYDSSVTKITNFKLNNASITSTAANTLVGILAGYVNGPITNVGVQGSSINEKSWTDSSSVVHNISSVSKLGTIGSKTFNKISEYGIVGYCEEAYKSQLKTTKTEVYNSVKTNSDYTISEEGSEYGWGGSIDMLTMYNDVRSVWDTFSTDSNNIYSYPTTRTIVEDENGNVISDTYGNYQKYSFTSRFGNSSVDETMYYYGYNQRNAQDKITSSYTLVHRSGSDSYMYMYGHGNVTKTQTNVLTTTRTYYETRSGAFYITDVAVNPSHHLSASGNSIVDETNGTNAKQWLFDASNRLYTTVDGDIKYISNSSTLSLTDNTASAAQWRTNGQNTQFYFTGANDYDRHYLVYDNGWKLVAYTVPLYIYHNNCYLAHSGGKYSAVPNKSDATEWYIDGSNNVHDADGYFINYKKTYGGVFISYVNGAELEIAKTPSDGGKLTYSSGKLSATFSYLLSSHTHYLRCNGSAWSLPETDTTLTWEEVVPPYYVAKLNGTSIKVKKTEETKSNTSTFETGHTFFPLRQENGVPKDTNTGYVISGADPDEPMGQIRVSEYSSSSLTNGLGTVYTINGSGRTQITDANKGNYKKYETSKASLQSVFDSDTSHIYGLHFMSGNIEYGSNGVSAVAENATINGDSFINYELPTNCIDFNLKEKGYINFFAGSYFPDNNSFFSLYEIERNSSNGIVGLKKITEVLSDSIDSHSYCYKFSDNTYSVPFKFNDLGNKVKLDDTAYTKYSTTSTKPTNYTTVFQTAWIETNSLTSNAAYYFEIPMNDGEYALGSVSGGTGAYLMYLDIGANAKNIHRTEILEYFKLITGTTNYAVGCGFIAAGSTASDMNSFCVTIKETYNGLLTFNRTSDSVATYTDSSSSANVELVYRYGAVAVNPNAQGVSEEPTYSTSVKEIKRLTYYDFDPRNNTTTKIVITDVFVDGVREGTRTVQKWSKWDFTNETGTADSSVVIYDADGHAVTNTNNITVNTSACNSVIFSFANYYPGVGTITVDFSLDASKQVSDKTTVANINGYIITVTLTRSSGTENITSLCKIIDMGNGTYAFKINGENITANGQEITVNLTLGS